MLRFLIPVSSKSRYCPRGQVDCRSVFANSLRINWLFEMILFDGLPYAKASLYIESGSSTLIKKHNLWNDSFTFTSNILYWHSSLTALLFSFGLSPLSWSSPSWQWHLQDKKTPKLFRLRCFLIFLWKFNSSWSVPNRVYKVQTAMWPPPHFVQYFDRVRDSFPKLRSVYPSWFF